jgi:hypothetical protein
METFEVEEVAYSFHWRYYRNYEEVWSMEQF